MACLARRRVLPRLRVLGAEFAIKTNTLQGRFPLKRNLLMASVAVAFSLAYGMAPGSAEAKTLVYCSEGSPEGFNPALFTAGTTFDAGSRQP